MMSMNLATAVLLAASLNLPTAQQPAAPSEKQAPKLAAELEPFRPLLGRTFTAKFPPREGQAPASDIQRWERMLNGQGIRLVHSVNAGSYGGETIFTYDKPAKTLRYHYFTTAGFMTVGTVRCGDRSFETHEKIKGTGTDVAEVKGTTAMKPDGTLIVTTKMLRDGKWEDRGTVTYKETPKAKVVFR